MKTKLIWSFLCFTLLFSCRNSIRPETTVTATTVTATDTVTHSRLDSIVITAERIDTGFAAVYQFGHLVIMTFEEYELRDTANKLDVIFEDLYQKDSFNTAIDDWTETGRTYRHRPDLQLMDTFSAFTIWRSTHLSTRMLPLIEKEYYVYGTKGYMKCKVRDAVFYSGACNAFYGFALDGYDEHKCGHPLFSHSKEIPLRYDGDYSEAQANLDKITKEKLRDSSDYYKNYIPAKIIAHWGKNTVVYCDDFTWAEKGSNSKTLFPSRDVQTGGHRWSYQFDAFGVPCD